MTIRLDADVVDHFRSRGPGWQTRLNAELHRAVFGASAQAEPLSTGAAGRDRPPLIDFTTVPTVGRVLPAGARRRTRRNIGLRTGTPPEKTAWRHSREHPAPGLHPFQEQVARPPVSVSHHSLKNNPLCDMWGRCIPVLAEYAPLVIYRTDCAPRTRPHGAAALGHRAFSSGAARTAPASVPEVAS